MTASGGFAQRAEPAAKADPGSSTAGQDVLKDEPYTRIVVDRTQAPPLFVKTYSNPGWLLWRTIGQASRSAREFASLEAARLGGVPCVEPVEWDERRRFCCVLHSTLTLVFEDGMSSMRDVLRGIAKRSQSTPVSLADCLQRRHCARGFGVLLRAVHEAGVLWGTVTPRNVLVRNGQIEQPSAFIACDMPMAIRFRRPILGGRAAALDLFDAAFSPGRRSEFRRTDRMRLVMQYAQGDRVVAKALWRRLSRWPRWWQRAQKAGWRSYSIYLVGMLSRASQSLGSAFRSSR